jgi:hypothetical protein
VRSVKNRNNVLVTKTAEVLAVWKDYFEGKFGKVELGRQCKRHEVKDKYKDREEGTGMENGISNIERAEVEEAVGRITLWKAAGADDIHPELIKYGGNKLIDEMTKLLRQAWDWNSNVIVPIFKNGNSNDCNNYRAICLSPVVLKIYTRLLEIRLREIVEPELEEEQGAYRPLHQTQDPRLKSCI